MSPSSSLMLVSPGSLLPVGQQGFDLFKRRCYINLGVRVYRLYYAYYGHVDLCGYLVYVVDIVGSYARCAAEYGSPGEMSHHVQSVERLTLDRLT